MKNLQEDKGFRRFESFDWNGWAGAGEFEGGGQPFVMDCALGLIVADAGGMVFCAAPDFEENVSRAYVSHDQHEAEAEAVLTAIALYGDKLTPKILQLAFGFKEVR
jgi:hypothetical protein